MECKEVEYENAGCICLTYYRYCWWVAGGMVMPISISFKGGNSLD
jgi:hypothetical protein